MQKILDAALPDLFVGIQNAKETFPAPQETSFPEGIVPFCRSSCRASPSPAQDVPGTTNPTKPTFAILGRGQTPALPGVPHSPAPKPEPKLKLKNPEKGAPRQQRGERAAVWREKGLQGCSGGALKPQSRAAFQGIGGLTSHSAPEHPLCCVRMSFVPGSEHRTAGLGQLSTEQGLSHALGRDWAGEQQSRR